jgi:electron transfer flavoprotein beta subunit
MDPCARMGGVQIAVLTKQIPNPDTAPRLDGDGLLVREGGVLDPGDEVGLELALRLVEADEGEVTVVSMGPDDAAGAIRRAMAMGAHEGIHVSDPALRGADALVTARVLAGVLRRAPFDLVVAGVESTDGYTGTMPVTLAASLEVPSVTAVRALRVEGGALRLERQTTSGYDVIRCPMPAVVTVTAGATEPRYPSLKGIMQAKQKPLEQLDAAALGLGPDDLRSMQRVVDVQDAPAASGGEVVPASQAPTRIADLLVEARVL